MSNKGIRHVRESINKRKKQRGFPMNESNATYKNTITPLIPQDEEKHGIYPTFSDQPIKSEKPDTKFFASYMLKGTLSLVLFLGVSLTWNADSRSATFIDKWKSQALTEDFPFARVNHWYENTFGSPLPLTDNSEHVSSEANSFALPVSGSISQNFQDNGKGIMINPNETVEVSPLQDGVVTFAGNSKETNKTVVVQHSDGSKTTYGYLDKLDVHIYQFVNSTQVMGEFTPNSESKSVYFSVEKDSQYVDPMQVIEVNDSQ